MKKVLVDALPCWGSGGISHYINPLIAHLMGLPEAKGQVEILARVGLSWKRYGKYRAWRSTQLWQATRHHLFPCPDRLLSWWWTHNYADWLGDKAKCGIFLATTDFVPSPNRNTWKEVVWVVYDIIPYLLPDFFNATDYYRHWQANAARTARIVTISEATCRDLVERMGYPSARITVIPPGITPPHPHPSPPPCFATIRRPYILYLGALALNKNVDGLLRIFAKCIQQHKLDLDLVLTGRDFCPAGFWQNLAKSLKIADRTHFAGWVTDSEREYLLQNTLMLWQFSWYEGFGLPILEAASRGIPVLYSNRGALPEILNNPEQEIDPADEQAAAAKAASACQSPALLQRWRALEQACLSRFSWERSAQKLIEFLKGVK